MGKKGEGKKHCTMRFRDGESELRRRITLIISGDGIFAGFFPRHFSEPNYGDEYSPASARKKRKQKSTVNTERRDIKTTRLPVHITAHPSIFWKAVSKVGIKRKLNMDKKETTRRGK